MKKEKIDKSGGNFFVHPRQIIGGTRGKAGFI